MWPRIRSVVVLVAAALVLPVLVAVVGVSQAVDEVYPARDRVLRAWPAAPSRSTKPRIDPDRPTVAIVLGEQGANVADSLAPYEVFARTGRFNVLAVAPTTDPVTLTGGLDVVPHLSFAELGRRLDGPPDVIVVPQVHGSTTAVTTWLRAQRRQGAPLVMGVCVGVEAVADAGLLEGRPATTHWLKLIGVRRSHPDVRWTDGVRFVDDGDVITTAGVLSGIDGSLRVVERLVGPGAATRVADELHWSGYRPDRPLDTVTLEPAPADLVALLSASYRWDRPTVSVPLADGIGEIELASVFRPYSELSYLARLEAVSADGASIRSRHGLTFLPRGDLAAVAESDRVLVPGAGHVADVAAAGADAAGGPVTRLHRGGEFPFDGTLRDIAGTYDAATARWVAKSLQYDPRAETPAGSAWPWGLALRPVALAGLGVVLVVVLRRFLSRRTGSGESGS